MTPKNHPYHVLQSALRVCVLTLVTWAHTGHSAFGEGQVVDNLVEQWLAIERQTAAIEQSWQQQKPLLTQRKALMQDEIQQLETRLAQKHDGDSEVDQQREALLEEQSAIELEQQHFAEALAQLESRLKDLQALIPPPVANQWEQEAAELTADAEPSQRLKVALAQLGSLLDFDQRISVHQMPITTPAADTVVVKQFYLGSALAWFLSPDGSYAGTGQSLDGQWQWQFEPDINADAIADAIAVYDKTRTPTLVSLPVTVGHH